MPTIFSRQSRGNEQKKVIFLRRFTLYSRHYNNSWHLYPGKITILNTGHFLTLHSLQWLLIRFSCPIICIDTFSLCYFIRGCNNNARNSNDSMNIGKSSQLGKQGFGSLHNLTWTCCLNDDILLRHWLRFGKEVD